MSLASWFLVLAVIGLLMGIISFGAVRVSGALPAVARRLAGPPEVKVGRLIDADELPSRPVRVTGRIRCRDALDAGDGERLVALPGERHPDGAAHGSGCTHSATLAARLALGDDPVSAARTARTVASEAVRDGLRELGAGPGPVHVLGAIITRP